MPNYDALTSFLISQKEPVITVTFTELDRMVNGLPASAHKHPAWWATVFTPMNMLISGWMPIVKPNRTSMLEWCGS